MKKALCLAAFLVMAAQLPLSAYDTSPSIWQVVPEAIWAPATGGGVWVTELQITSFGTVPATINVYFDYAGGSRGLFTLYSGLAQYTSVRYTSILAELQTLDPSFVYFGRVGALWLQTADSDSRIQVQAKTVNGNFGKTFPGITPLEGTTGSETRNLILQDLAQNVTYRTSVGLYNTTSTAIMVTLTIINQDNLAIGNPIIKTINAYGFMSFNPFTQALAPAGNYANCWLRIEVTSGGSASEGLVAYGSIANNFTNDTYALIAKQLDSGATMAPAPPIRH